MFKPIISIVAILLCVAFSSCRKYPGDVNKFYQGIWSTDTVLAVELGYNIHSFIIISEAESSAGLLCDPSCYSCSCLDFTEGKARINKKETGLRVGNVGRTMFLKITEPPHQDASGRWVMKIDSQNYYRR